MLHWYVLLPAAWALLALGGGVYVAWVSRRPTDDVDDRLARIDRDLSDRGL